MRVRLIPADGSAAVELTKEVAVVGRGDDCEVRVEHKSVSKRHCVLVITDGLVLLRDLGSTNGTRVNGTRVRRAALLPNDQVAFANFRYTVAFGASAASAPALPASTIPPPPDDDDDFEVGPAEEPPPPGVRLNALPDEYDD